MHKKNIDFTLLIQGEITRFPRNLKKTIEKHIDQFNIIICGYNHEDTKFLKKYPVTVLTIPYFNSPLRNTTLEYQIETTLNGLLHITSPFTIKMRTDEYYENLDPILDIAYEHPDKYITNNIFFISANQPHEVLHPSDHVICSKTTMFQNGLKTAKSLLRHIEQNPFQFKYTHSISTEAWLFCSWLKGNGLDFSEALDTIEGANRVLKKYAYCVDINLMGEVSWWCNKINYTNDDYLFSNGFNQSIKSTKELC